MNISKPSGNLNYNSRPLDLPTARRAVLSRAQILKSQIMRRYADWKIGATTAEKYLYKSSESIVLTFDDFGSEVQLTRILNILRDENIRAVFFLQGDWTRHNADLVARIRARGHVIGNHTYSHPDLLALSDAEVEREIRLGPDSLLLRPPMGRYDQRIRRLARKFDQRIAYWSLDSDDWKGVSTAYMYEKITRLIHPGAVILFHLHADNTATLLPLLIPALRRRGYRFLDSTEQFEDGQ